MSAASPEPEPVAEWRLDARSRRNQEIANRALQLLVDADELACAYALDEAVRGITEEEWLGPEFPTDAIYLQLPSWNSPPLRASAILHLLCGVERRLRAESRERSAGIQAELDLNDAEAPNGPH